MAPVFTLALDTSSPAGSIAILREGKLIASQSESSAEPYSSRLFRQLEDLLHELRFNLSQFDLFAACSGPGSFTGLRVGLTTAKAWAETFGRPIAAVSALDAVAIQASDSDALLIPLTDARRGQVYFGAARAQRHKTTTVDIIREAEDRVAPPEDFLEFLRALPSRDHARIVTPTPAILSPVENQIRELGISIEKASPFLAPFVARLGVARAERGIVTDALALDANYVRRSDAELHWKAD